MKQKQNYPFKSNNVLIYHKIKIAIFTFNLKLLARELKRMAPINFGLKFHLHVFCLLDLFEIMYIVRNAITKYSSLDL